MSEQAEIAPFQKQIQEAEDKERIAFIGMSLGGVVAVLGFGLYFNLSYGGWSSLFSGITGVVILSLGAVASNRLNERKKKLIRQLDNLGTKIPACRRCGKQIPQDKFAFCPFCGTELWEQ